MLVPFFLFTAISLLLSLSLTPIVRLLAVRWNLVDKPDNKRKVHQRPTPRVGGIAVGGAYFGSLALLGIWLHFQHSTYASGLTAIQSIVPSAVLVFLIGLADDILDLKPRNKFAGQIVAATLAVIAGVHIPGLQLGAVPFGLGPVLGMALSVVWLVLCTNAVNLIDGLDGLAGGISMLATLTILIAALASGNMGLALATAPLAAALVGFLVFNFNPASIFLGDCGSLLLGFLLGCYSLLWSGSASTPFDLAAPFMVLAVPILDVTLAVTRRFLRHQPIFKADRSHIHHRLLARGFSHRNTVLLLYVAAATAGSLALGLHWLHDLWQPVMLAAFLIAAVFGIQQLGYVEFDALRQVIQGPGLRSGVSAHIALQTLESTLASAATIDDCWTAIQNACEEFGFYAIRMQLAGVPFYSVHDTDDLRFWAMRIGISKSSWIELSQNTETVRYPTALVPFANKVRDILADKSRSWETQEQKAADYAPAALYTPVASIAN